MGLFLPEKQTIEERDRTAELKNAKDTAAWFRNLHAAAKLLVARADAGEKKFSKVSFAGKEPKLTDQQFKELKDSTMALYDITPKIAKML